MYSIWHNKSHVFFEYLTWKLFFPSEVSLGWCCKWNIYKDKWRGGCLKIPIFLSPDFTNFKTILIFWINGLKDINVINGKLLKIIRMEKLFSWASILAILQWNNLNSSIYLQEFSHQKKFIVEQYWYQIKFRSNFWEHEIFENVIWCNRLWHWC